MSIWNKTKALYWKATGVPHVTTTYGHERVDALKRKDVVHEDERARAEAVEYWRDHPDTGEPELVHRSVTIALKQGIEIGWSQGNIG